MSIEEQEEIVVDKYRFQQIEYRMKDKPSWQVIGTKIDGKVITEEEYVYVERLRKKKFLEGLQ